MTIQYLISSCFMLAILIIFVKKGGSDIRHPRSRRIYLWLLAFIIAYVIIDAFFLLFYISPSNVTGYRIITFVFYIIYVLMPFVWHIFVRNFVGGSYPKIIQRLEYIPLLLLFGMILYNIPSRTLWYITATSDYQRGSWFTAFSILNMFYYVDSLFHAVVITYKKRQTSEPYLLQSVFISFIPFVGIVLNAFVIPINIMYPVQPFCIVLGAILAYFFMADHETQILQAQYQKKLKDALHQEKIATKQIIEANKIKSKFLANISHDIRTPLNAILGFSNIIAKDPSDIESVTNANEKIQVSGDILLTLVNEVLDFNRLENGKLEIHPISTDLRNLGKDGGYTSATYFTVPQLTKDKNADPVQLGTDGGGCIEVYKNIDDAKTRCDYLKSFDGSILPTGSYSLIGTMIVRTSYQLDDASQYNLTDEIFSSLTNSH